MCVCTSLYRVVWMDAHCTITTKQFHSVSNQRHIKFLCVFDQLFNAIDIDAIQMVFDINGESKSIWTITFLGDAENKIDNGE